LAELELDYILVIIDNDAFDKSGIKSLGEGRWVTSNEKGWSLKIDAENPSMEQQRHIHIARDKYLNTKDRQVAWIKERIGYYPSTLNQNMKTIEIAKRIAGDALKLDDNVVFEHVSKLSDILELMTLFESNPSIVLSAQAAPVLLQATFRLPIKERIPAFSGSTLNRA
jgi:hypothetical protein